MDFSVQSYFFVKKIFHFYKNLNVLFWQHNSYLLPFLVSIFTIFNLRRPDRLSIRSNVILQKTKKNQHKTISTLSEQILNIQYLTSKVTDMINMTVLSSSIQLTKSELCLHPLLSFFIHRYKFLIIY